MALPTIKVVGKRGQWIAEVSGRELAVLHETWWTPPHAYYDPFEVGFIAAKYDRLVNALRSNEHAIVQRDDGSEKMQRVGYAGVFRFSGLEIGDDHSIQLKIEERVANVRNR